MVDALTEIAAVHVQAPPRSNSLVNSAEAMEHAVCLLGGVTHTANRERPSVLVEGGSSATKTSRDSTDKPGAMHVGRTPDRFWFHLQQAKRPHQYHPPMSIGDAARGPPHTQSIAQSGQ